MAPEYELSRGSMGGDSAFESMYEAGTSMTAAVAVEEYTRIHKAPRVYRTLALLAVLGTVSLILVGDTFRLPSPASQTQTNQAAAQVWHEISRVAAQAWIYGRGLMMGQDPRSQQGGVVDVYIGDMSGENCRDITLVAASTVDMQFEADIFKDGGKPAGHVEIPFLTGIGRGRFEVCVDGPRANLEMYTVADGNKSKSSTLLVSLEAGSGAQ